MRVEVDEVVAPHEGGGGEVGRAAECSAVLVGDAGVEHGHGDAAAARRAEPGGVGPGVGRVDPSGGEEVPLHRLPPAGRADRKSTRLNSSHLVISYAVFCLKKK